MDLNLPILGYNVWWGLHGVRVDQATLERAYRQAGCGDALPEPPTDIEALRRALNTWRRERQRALVAALRAQGAGPIRARDVQILVRPINRRGAAYAVFGLVGEQVDFARLGLQYATQARVLIEKLPPAERALREPAFRCTTAAEGVIAAEAEARALTEAIRPLWRAAKTTYLARDLSASVLSLIARLPSAVCVRQRGGVYFVRATDEARLLSIKRLVESLPTGPGAERPYLLMLPVVDAARARAELATAIQRGFLAELHVAGTRLADLRSKAKRVAPATVAQRLVEIRAIRDRARVYSELLDIQQEQINAAVADLNRRAQAVLAGNDEDTDTEEVDAEEADAEEADLETMPS